jgi:PAS domain S-box-containing protein
VTEYNKDNHRFLQAILHYHTDSVVLIDPDGYIQYRNDSLRPLLGWEAEEVVGSQILDYVHEQDRATFEANLTLARQQQRIVTAIYRIKSKYNGYQWIESDIHLAKLNQLQGLIIRSRDVSEKVEAEAREKAHQANYESLFFNHPDAVSRWNTAGLVEDINARAERLFGYRKAEVIGRHFLSFVEPHFADAVQEAFQKTLLGKPGCFRGRAYHQNGSWRETISTLIPVLLDGQVVKIQAITQDVTPLTRAHELLKEQGRIQSSIFESINEGFCALDRQWRLTYLNKVCAGFLPQTREEALNKCLLDLLPQLATALFYNQCQQVWATGKPAAFHEYFPCDNITLSFKIYPLEEDKLAVHFIDITEKLAAQQELEKLSHIANKVNTGVLIVNHAGSMEWANESFTALTGYTLAEMAGLKPGEQILDAPETGEQTVAWIKSRLRQGLPFTADVVLRNKKGEKRWFTADATPVPGSSPAERKTYVILTDISQRKEAEDKLQQQAEELFRHNRDLQQFTYIVSHNLRAPVANAVGFATLLQGLSKEAPAFEEIRDKLHESVQRLDTVIKDLNTILSVRDKTLAGERQPVLIAAVCQQVKAGLQQSLQEAGGHLELDLDADASLDANKAYLYSIFYNLLNNAIKYRAENGPLQIKITSAYSSQGELVVAVTDNGAGMDLNRVGPDLFKLYKRFNSSKEGKGMGLFLVKTQVEALGGRIEVSSQPDQGTTFTLYFKPL